MNFAENMCFRNANVVSCHMVTPRHGDDLSLSLPRGLGGGNAEIVKLAAKMTQVGGAEPDSESGLGHGPPCHCGPGPARRRSSSGELDL